MAGGDQLSWIYRVKSDENSVLFRAAANYASKGYDPQLANAQINAEIKARPPDPAKVEAQVASQKVKLREGTSKLPPTPYESGFTGRALLSALPSDRQQAFTATNRHPELEMTKGAPLIKPRIGIVVEAKAKRASTDSMGVMRAKPRQLQGAEGGGDGANPFSSLHNAALVPAPAAQHIGTRSVAAAVDGEVGGALPLSGLDPSLPPGALSYSLQDNAVGKTDACPRGPGANRGGSGLIAGLVTTHRDAMVPAALVIAKWARLLKTDYGATIGDPVRYTVEMQPLFYESLMMDLGSVTGGNFEFKPQIEPAVFMVDVGSVNRKIHGAAAATAAVSEFEGAAQNRQQYQLEDGITGGDDQQKQFALVPSTPGRATTVRYGGGSGATTTAQSPTRGPPLQRDTKSRQRRREMEALCRLEMRAVVAEGTQRAEEYLRGVSRMGDDKELVRLLKEGYAVSYTPHPWYKRMDLDGAARDRDRRGSTAALQLGNSSSGRAGLGTSSTAGFRGRSASAAQQPGGGTSTALARFGSNSPPPATAATDVSTLYSDAPDSMPLARLGTASTGGGINNNNCRQLALRSTTASAASSSLRPGSTVVDIAGFDGDRMGTRGLPMETLYVLPDVNSADPEGNTAVMLAARNGWIECVKLLLEAGADHRKRNNSGQTAYDLARVESELAGVALNADHPGAGLRKRRAALTAALLDDRSILECAQKGDMRRLRHLVEGEGHPVNSANSYGMTALHFAVLKRDVEMAAFLSQHGADPLARNNLGQTPSSLCMDAVGESGVQEALLAALQEGPLQEARRKHAAENAAELIEAQRKANADLARKLREFTKGTTAAKMIQLSMPPGVKPDFRPVVPDKRLSGGETSSSFTTTTTAAGGGRRSSSVAAADVARNATAPSQSTAEVGEIERRTAALKASWNRHALDYMSLQQKQLEIKAARDAALKARTGSLLDAEARRFQSVGKRFTPADAASTVARIDSGGAGAGSTVAPGLDGIPLADGAVSSGAATALWGTDAVRGARTDRRRSEPLIRAAAGLADPEALSAALKSYAPPPGITDRKFDTWMRMRFGAGALK